VGDWCRKKAASEPELVAAEVVVVVVESKANWISQHSRRCGIDDSIQEWEQLVDWVRSSQTSQIRCRRNWRDCHKIICQASAI
jgi:hypothetical protein